MDDPVRRVRAGEADVRLVARGWVKSGAVLHRSCRWRGGGMGGGGQRCIVDRAVAVRPSEFEAVVGDAQGAEVGDSLSFAGAFEPEDEHAGQGQAAAAAGARAEGRARTLARVLLRPL